MELLIATSNNHKVEEFKEILEPLGFNIKSLLDLKMDEEIEENGNSFKENALIKARYISKKYNINCIADDSGLEIKELNNEPGIYSARYLGHDTSYEYKNSEIIKKLKTKKDRSARFVCVIALVYTNGEEYTFEGIMNGSIAYEITGTNGFGYDPIFFYKPFNTTIACVSSKEKNSVSHRGIAIKKLVNFFENK